MGSRTARVVETMDQHRPGRNQDHRCSCGFPIAGEDTQEQHQARAIVSRLFGTRNPDADDILDPTHRGHPDNIALHRALGEPLCAACTGWLDSRAG